MPATHHRTRLVVLLATLGAPASALATPALHLGTSGEIALGDDGTLLWGPSIGICGRVSWACIGGNLRLAVGNRESEGAVPSGEITTIEGLGYLQGRFGIGDLSLAPILGLGVGWYRVDTDFVSVPLDGGGQTFVSGDGTVVGVRVELGLSFAYQLVRGADLELSFSAVFSPLASDDQLPQGFELTRLPLNEPVVYFRGGLGLRFGIGAG